MKWLLENPKLLIALVIIGAYVLRAFTQKRPPAAEPDERTTSTPSAEDPAEAERTRRIQEEIRRKIVERQRGAAPPPVPAAPPDVIVFDREEETEAEYDGEGPAPRRDVPPPLPHTPERFPEPPPLEPAGDSRASTDGLVEQQRAMLERLQALRSARGAPAARPPSLSGAPDAGTAARGAAMRRDLRHMLREKGSLRRAVLLREILGEPLGLKRGPLVLPRR